jgi:thioredoxin 1
MAANTTDTRVPAIAALIRGPDVAENFDSCPIWFCNSIRGASEMAHQRSFRSILSWLSIVGIAIGALLSCSNAEKPTQKDTTTQRTIGDKVTPKAQITFVELGSVNCIPCRMMQPVMKEIDSIYAGRVKVMFIDVLADQGRPFAGQYKIQAIPTQIFLDAQDNELARHTGFYPKDSIVALLAAKGLK